MQLQQRLARSGLYRATYPSVGGVCAGLAERIDTEALAVRVLFVVLTLMSQGWFLLAYVALWILMPRREAPLEATTPPASANTDVRQADPSVLALP